MCVAVCIYILIRYLLLHLPYRAPRNYCGVVLWAALSRNFSFPD